MNRAGDQAVHLVERQHHRAEPDVVAEKLGGVFGSESLVFAHFDERRDVICAKEGRIQDFEVCRKLDFQASGDSLNLVGIAQQDAAGDISLRAKGGRADGARFVALGKDDAFLRSPRALGETIAETPRATSAFPREFRNGEASQSASM